MSDLHINEIERQFLESQLISERKRLAKRIQKDHWGTDCAAIAVILIFVFTAIILLFPR
jgi:hypothetical protein